MNFLNEFETWNLDDLAPRATKQCPLGFYFRVREAFLENWTRAVIK